MIVDFKYSIGEKVALIDIDFVGVIRAMRWDMQGAQYNVTYWHDSQMRDAWVFVDELRKIEK